MIRIPPLRGPVSRGMAVVVAACIVLDVFVLVRAAGVQRAVVATGTTSASTPRLPEFRRDTSAQPDDSVPDDPFDPDRGAVVAQAGATTGVPAAPVPTAAPVALIGTVVRAGGGSVAVCRAGNEAPRVLRVGEQIGGLTLLEVEQGRASFRDNSGARVSLRIAPPGA